jgi:hypothetical protein
MNIATTNSQQIRAELDEMEADSGNEFAAQRDLPQLLGAARRALDLADRLETDEMRHLQPWMIARLLRVAITDDLSAAVTPEAS